MTEEILIPTFVEGREFCADSVSEALRACQKAGFEAVFMPQLADARIAAPKEAQIWHNWYCAPSIRATGKTAQGTPVVIYAHVLNYFSNPKNIETAINSGLVNGAGRMPESEFQRLLDLQDDDKVFVVDYTTIKNSPSGVIALGDALKHPQTIPFLGGKERAERYLERHKEVFGEKMGVWHSDDLRDEPIGRLLFLGDVDNYGLYGDGDLSDGGRFVGVRRVVAGSGAQKPNLESLIGKGTDVGNGLVVVRKDEISDVGYALLTGKQ